MINLSRIKSILVLFSIVTFSFSCQKKRVGPEAGLDYMVEFKTILEVDKPNELALISHDKSKLISFYKRNNNINTISAFILLNGEYGTFRPQLSISKLAHFIADRSTSGRSPVSVNDITSFTLKPYKEEGSLVVKNKCFEDLFWFKYQKNGDEYDILEVGIYKNQSEKTMPFTILRKENGLLKRFPFN